MKIFNKTKVTLALFVAVLVAGFAFAETAQVTKTLWSEGKTFDTDEFGQIDLPGTAVKVGDKLIITYEKAGSAFQDNARAAAPMRDISRTAEVRIFVDEASEPLKAWEELTDAGTLEYTFEAAIAATSKITISARNLTITKVELETEEEAATDLISQYFYNTDFASTEHWTPVVSNGYRDYGYGLIGTYVVQGSNPAATVDETHLATEYCLGTECRWETNYSSLTQESFVEFPAGAYKLMYDVQNTNAGTTKAAYDNLFKVIVGDTEYVDESTEWMEGATSWTTHSILFNVAEPTKVTISFGYGTGNYNYGSANTPALYISHLQLEEVDQIDVALAELEAAIAAAQAQASTYAVGEGLFYYPASEIEPLNNAIAAAQAAYSAAESKEAVETATATLNAFLSTFAPAMNVPVADKLYAFQLRVDGEVPVYMALAEEGISIAEKATALKFIEAENAGEYYLSNEDGTLYVGLAGGNAWTMSAVADKKAAWTFTPMPDGAYRINNLVTKGRFVGTNAADKAAGSPCYADKQPSNGNIDWLIAEATAEEPGDDYTSYIVNANLTSTDPKGFDDAGTKGIDGSGIVKVATQAQFDFKQTISLPAGKYKLTAQAAYRYGADEQAEYDAMQTNAVTKLVQLYATVGSKTVTQPVQNRYDGASDTDYANGSGSVTVNGKFVPNSSSAVQAWFAAGQYVNEVEFNLPADGDVTIGINRVGTPESDYTVIGPWTLTRIGDAETEPEPPVVEPGSDMTSYITNPSFETGDLTGWTVGSSSDTGVKPNSNATYTTEGCDGDYLFNTWWQGIPITQTVTGLPNGTYELKALMANDAITAGNQPCLYLLANGEHSAAFSSATAGVFAEGSMQFYVTNGTATIGANGGNADGSFNEAGYYWYKVDNFRLTFVEALPSIDDIEIPEGKMSNAAAAALTEAKQSGDVIALLEAVKAANASIEAYAKMKSQLDAIAAILDETNFYTAEAKTAFDTEYNAKLAAYEAGTATDAEAAAFNYGSRLEGLIPTLLLSAFTSTVEGTPYINTWSVEGNNDGSNFLTPFYEYWTGDANSLGANTITGELLGLEAGEYEVTAWVRVRVKNGAEAPATGITMQVNEGEAVAIAGDQVGTSQMYLKEYTATGTVAEGGALKIKFDVAADNNVSWLSFKNVKYTKKGGTQPEPVEGILYSWESPEGTPVEYGGTIVYTNGDGERVNYPNAGYYTICLNGKKANINDETASANAGHMVITLNEAITEDCAISMDAYINKNATDKKASAYFIFETGTEFEGPVYSDEANIDETVGGQITNTVTEIPATAVGSKTIKITRGQTGTNLFITKLVIGKKDVVTGIENVTVTRSDIEGIYNLRGQRVLNPTKGLYIINGKKVIIR